MSATPPALAWQKDQNDNVWRNYSHAFLIREDENRFTLYRKDKRIGDTREFSKLESAQQVAQLLAYG